MATHMQHPRDASKRGNPEGTYFAITMMIILVVLVGLYFVVDHLQQLQSSPALQSSSAV